MVSIQIQPPDLMEGKYYPPSPYSYHSNSGYSSPAHSEHGALKCTYLRSPSDCYIENRDHDNCSPRSVGSMNSYGSYFSPSPRTVDTPSPPTTASATKLYNLLKDPSSSYNPEETWREDNLVTDSYGAINLKRKYVADEPMDLSCRKKHKVVEDNSRLRNDSIDSGRFSEASDDELPRSSILESVLSGRATTGSKANCSIKAWESLKEENHLNDTSPHTVSSHSYLPPASPFSSASSTCSSSASFSLRKSTNQTVKLAKKNLLPVTARVSDWMVKITNFGSSMPEYTSLPEEDRINLTLNSWSRLLLLHMAENGFQFAVTPSNVDLTDAEGEANPSEDTPTMKSVDQIQSFIKKCQHLGIDSKEFYYLKIITLFQSSGVKMQSSQYLDNVSACARQALKDHTQAAHAKSRLRYSQLLLTLPLLYSINSKMLENLFCPHLADSSDIDSLLTEMIKKV